jgi:hypothetical protein
VTAALTLGANLLRLVHTPALYGQRWDAMIDQQFTPAAAGHRLGRLPGIAGWTFGYDTATVRIGGRQIGRHVGQSAGSGSAGRRIRGHSAPGKWPPGERFGRFLGAFAAFVLTAGPAASLVCGRLLACVG